MRYRTVVIVLPDGTVVIILEPHLAVQSPERWAWNPCPKGSPNTLHEQLGHLREDLLCPLELDDATTGRGTSELEHVRRCGR